ncbi:MAG: EXLDI protein [Clostridia bacterium]|nr:EXLDI protein [Clostridia bacterium]
MPAKTIYIRESDLEIFDRAEKLGTAESLSAAIAEALRRYVAAEEARLKGMEEITLTVGTWGGGQGEPDTKKVRFTGRLLADGRTYADRDTRGVDWAIYQTKKGQILLYRETWSRWQGEESAAVYRVYPSLGELADANPDLPGSILERAREALGLKTVEELDV